MDYSINSIPSLISNIHMLTADFTNHRLAQKGKLVSSHGFILFLLSQNEQMTMGDIARSINRDKSTTTVLVRKLKTQGLVKETPSETDSRSKLISLTKKGQDYNKFTAELSNDLISVSLKGFSASEKKTFLDLLVKMQDNVNSSFEKKGGKQETEEGNEAKKTTVKASSKTTAKKSAAKKTTSKPSAKKTTAKKSSSKK